MTTCFPLAYISLLPHTTNNKDEKIISAFIGFLSISNAGYIPIKFSVYVSLIVGGTIPFAV
mgnify:CR=1 FL=1